jgi:hypothetical protein
MEIPARAEMDLRSPAKKKRFQGMARKRMTSASGFTWFAREPKLIVGAEGRASSQRSTDYHSRARLRQRKTHRFLALAARFFLGPDGLCFPAAPAPVTLDATWAGFDARATTERERGGPAENLPVRDRTPSQMDSMVTTLLEPIRE